MIVAVHHLRASSVALDDPRVARAVAALPADEQERHGRFRFARHRHRFAVTRWLVRTVLAESVGCAPDALRFETNRWGRPELAAPQAGVGLRFNVSHTDEHIVLAVLPRGTDVPLGIDVESLDAIDDPVRLCDRYFAPAEIAALHALPQAAQVERFFALWTLKEAYIKARGMGLSLALDGFAFDVDSGDAPRISFAAGFDDDPKRWTFARGTVDERTRWAVACAGDHDAPEVEVRWVERAFGGVR